MKNEHDTHKDLPLPIIPGCEHLLELYYATWDLAKEHIAHRKGLTAEDYMDEGFEKDKIWQWDTCFMAMFCKYAPDLFPGIESLDNFYAAQKENGYIAKAHLEAVHAIWKNFEPHTLWECYAPDINAPATTETGELCRKNFVGWTGLGPIAMLIETILGIEVDYPNRKITWRTDIPEEHGIDNLRFGPHKISLRCAKRSDINEKPAITIDSPCEITIDSPSVD